MWRLMVGWLLFHVEQQRRRAVLLMMGRKETEPISRLAPFGSNKGRICYLSAILAHVSFRLTVRLKTILPGLESGSTQK